MTKLITIFYARKILQEHEAHFCLKFNNKLGTTPVLATKNNIKNNRKRINSESKKKLNSVLIQNN